MGYGYHLSTIQHRQLRWVGTLYRPSNPPVGHLVHAVLGLGNPPKMPETFRFGIHHIFQEKCSQNTNVTNRCFYNFPSFLPTVPTVPHNWLSFRKQLSSGVVLHQYHCAWMSPQVFAFDTSGGHGSGATRRCGQRLL